MRTQLTKIILTATIALALAFTFNGCSSSDTPNANTGIPSKSSCIKAEFEIKFNTLDEVAAACNATRSEILSQLPNIIGSCSKNNLDFDKPIKNIEESCGAEISVVGNSSSSGGTGSSSSSSENIVLLECNGEEYNPKEKYCSNGTIETYGSVTDKGGNEYKTVVIGEQTWMAENLNYATGNSWCYENEMEKNCKKYGRLYNWSTALNIPSVCNQTDCSSYYSKDICPDGWHVPNNSDWGKLFNFVDGGTVTEFPYSTSYNSITAGKYLKATSGWNDYNGKSGNGEDTYGFAALPGGGSGLLQGTGGSAIWWSCYSDNNKKAYAYIMTNGGEIKSCYTVYPGGYQQCTRYGSEHANGYSEDKINMASVRCVKDK